MVQHAPRPSIKWRIIVLACILFSHCSDERPKEKVGLTGDNTVLPAEDTETKLAYDELVDQYQDLAVLEALPKNEEVTQKIESLFAVYFAGGGVDLCQFITPLTQAGLIDTNTPSMEIDTCSLPVSANKKLYFRNLQVTIDKLFADVSFSQLDDTKIIQTTLDFSLDAYLYGNHFEDIAATIDLRLLLSISLNKESVAVTIDRAHIITFDSQFDAINNLAYSLMQDALTSFINQWIVYETETGNPGVGSFLAYLEQLTKDLHSEKDIYQLIAQMKVIAQHMAQSTEDTNVDISLPHYANGQIDTSLLSLDPTKPINLCRLIGDCKKVSPFVQNITLTTNGFERVFFKTDGTTKNFLFPVTFKLDIAFDQPWTPLNASIDLYAIIAVDLKSDKMKFKIIDFELRNIRLADEKFSPFIPIIKALVNNEGLNIINTFQPTFDILSLFVPKSIIASIWKAFAPLTTQEAMDATVTGINQVIGFTPENTYEHDDYDDFKSQHSPQTQSPVVKLPGTKPTSTVAQPSLLARLFKNYFRQQPTPLALPFKSEQFAIDYLRIYPNFSVANLTFDNGKEKKRMIIPLETYIEFSMSGLIPDKPISGNGQLNAFIELTLTPKKLDVAIVLIDIANLKLNHLEGFEKPVRNIFNQEALFYARTQTKQLASNLNSQLKSYLPLLWRLIDSIGNQKNLSEIEGAYHQLLTLFAQAYTDDIPNIVTTTSLTQRQKIVDTSRENDFYNIRDKLATTARQSSQNHDALQAFIALLKPTNNTTESPQNLCTAFGLPAEVIHQCEVDFDFSPETLWFDRSERHRRILVPLRMFFSYRFSNLIFNVDIEGEAEVEGFVRIDITPDGTTLKPVFAHVPNLYFANSHFELFSGLLKGLINRLFLPLLQKNNEQINDFLHPYLNGLQSFLWSWAEDIETQKQAQSRLAEIKTLTAHMVKPGLFDKSTLVASLSDLSYENASAALAEMVNQTTTQDPNTPSSTQFEDLVKAMVANFYRQDPIVVDDYLTLPHIPVGGKNVVVRSLELLPDIHFDRIYFDFNAQRRFIIPYSMYVKFQLDDVIGATDLAGDGVITSAIMFTAREKDFDIEFLDLNFTKLHLDQSEFNRVIQAPLQEFINGLALWKLREQTASMNALLSPFKETVSETIWPMIRDFKTQSDVDSFTETINYLVKKAEEHYFEVNPETAKKDLPYPFPTEDPNATFNSVFSRLNAQIQAYTPDPNAEFDLLKIDTLFTKNIRQLQFEAGRPQINVCQYLKQLYDKSCSVKLSGKTYTFRKLMMSFDSPIHDANFIASDANKRIQVAIQFGFEARIKFPWWFVPSYSGDGTASLPLVLEKDSNGILGLTLGELDVIEWNFDGIYYWIQKYIRSILLAVVNKALNAEQTTDQTTGLLTTTGLEPILTTVFDRINSEEELQETMAAFGYMIKRIHADIMYADFEEPE